MAYGAFVEKPNNNVIRTSGIFDYDKLKRSSAHLESQAMWTCVPTANNSGATWSKDYPDRRFNSAGLYQVGGAVIDQHFNPQLTNVAMFWYHYDENGFRNSVSISKSSAYSNVSIDYKSKHSPMGGWDPSTNQKMTSTSYGFWPFTSASAQLQLTIPSDWQNWVTNPIVPSSDEMTITTPNGDFMYVLEYHDQ